jgi:hypothetical protein
VVGLARVDRRTLASYVELVPNLIRAGIPDGELLVRVTRQIPI